MVLRDVARRPLRLLLSAASISLATAIVLSGSVLVESIDDALRLQFEVSHREDLTVTLDDSRPFRAVRDVAHTQGVRSAEGERQVPVRLRAGHRSRTTAILGLDPDNDLHKLVDRSRHPLALTSGGLSLSRVLGELLGVRAGDAVDVEVLEGDRRKLTVPVAALVDDLLGLSGYIGASELAKLLGETPRANVMLLSVEQQELDAVTLRLNALPAVASVGRPQVDRNLVRAQVADVFGILEVVLTIFAAAIAVGVVYNNARIAFEVRSRDLATMRILGFTRGELAFVLLGEQGLQVVLGVIPGLYLGQVMGGLTLSTIDRELLRIPVSVSPSAHIGAACVVLVAAVVSALIVRRQSDGLDLVAVLKARD